MLDLPGIIEGASGGKGRGREVIAVARSADLVLMILDGEKEQNNQHRNILERELETMGIRLNKSVPDIYYRVTAASLLLISLSSEKNWRRHQIQCHGALNAAR